MCYGFSGSPSLKSKADALKYAIEFTAIGEYPNRAPDIKKAKELYNFICENVQLPDVETDRLSNSLDGSTSLIEKLSKENETVNEVPEPTDEVVEEQTKETVISIPGSSYFSPISNNLRGVLRGYGFTCFSEGAANGYSKETFRLDGNGEYLDVTITHSTCPKKE
jgi:hypothetical protein